MSGTRRSTVLTMVLLLGIAACGQSLRPRHGNAGPSVASPGAAAVAPAPASAAAFPSGPEPFAAFLAAAPGTIDDSYLGAPVDFRFAPLQGPAGTSLFPTGAVRHTAPAKMDHRMLYMADSVEFSANARVWGVVSAGLGSDSSRRYAAYRAYQVETVAFLDDRVVGRAPPPGAVAYISAIHRGHLFEAVMSGSESTFHAGIKAQIGKYGGASRRSPKPRILISQ